LSCNTAQHSAACGTVLASTTGPAPRMHHQTDCITGVSPDMSAQHAAGLTYFDRLNPQPCGYHRLPSEQGQIGSHHSQPRVNVQVTHMLHRPHTFTSQQTNRRRVGKRDSFIAKTQHAGTRAGSCANSATAAPGFPSRSLQPHNLQPATCRLR
jgi:hypothetical protein